MKRTQLSNKVMKYIRSISSSGDMLTFVKTANSVISAYEEKFGRNAKQVIRINDDTIMSINDIRLHGTSLIIVGNAVTFNGDEIHYGETVAATVDSPISLNTAFSKMLYAIHSV
jgi:hypothetical protein